MLYRETPDGGINYLFLGDKLIAKEGLGVKASGDSIMNYKPFGDSIETAKDDVGYTGHKFDTDLGLSYMQARYYDPVIGRFYSNDPVDTLGHLSSGNIQGFNRYNYAYNNPYKYTDPDGKHPLLWFIGKEIVGAIVEETTGVSVPSAKNAGKSIAKNLSKKPLSRKLRRTKSAKDIKSRTGSRNGGKCEFCGDADATATDHLETTISEVADAVLDGEMTFEQADQAANNEGNAADSCTSCNSSKRTKKVGAGFKPKKLSQRLKEKLKQD